jgi:hypothetical protein
MIAVIDRRTHAGAHRSAADQYEHVAWLNAAVLDRRNRGRLREKHLGRAGEAIHAVGVEDGGIDGGALDDRAVRREIPAGQAHR